MEDSLDLAKYLSIVRRWLWLIVLCALLAAVAAYIVSINITPVYEATATLITEQSGNPFDNFTTNWALRNAQWEPLTYAKLLPLAVQATAAELGLEKIDQKNITVDAENETRVVMLRVRDTDPVRATRIANTLPVVFADYIESLQQDRYTESKETLREELDRLEADIDATQARIEAVGKATTAAQQAEMTRLEETLAQQRYNYGQLLTAYERVRMSEAQSQGTLLLFQEATVPQQPVIPKTELNTLLAAAVGGMLAVGAAFLIEHLDDTIKTPDDVKDALGLITLVAIPRVERKGESKPIVIENPLSPTAEIFRKLRTNIRFSGLDHPLRTLLVTSAGPSEGKSTAVVNLAAAMAQAGMKVIALDADLRRPRLHTLFGLAQGGLSESLLDGRVDGNVQPVQEVEGLALLAAGEKPPNPAEALGSQRMRELLAELTDQADIVLVDSPPVLPVTDAAVLAQAVDGVLLLVDSGFTRRQAAQQAVEELEQVGANVIGVVLNKVSTRSGGYYYHYYRAYYGEDKGKKKKRRRKKGLLDLLRPVSKQKQELVQEKPIEKGKTS